MRDSGASLENVEKDSGIRFPVSSLKAEALSLITTTSFPVLILASINLIMANIWIGLVSVITLMGIFIVPKFNRLVRAKLVLNEGLLTVEYGSSVKQFQAAGSRLTIVGSGKCSLLLPSGEEVELPLPTEWIDGQPIGSQFLSELKRSGCLVDHFHWKNVGNVTTETEQIHHVEVLEKSNHWYEGMQSNLDDFVKHKTKFSAVQTISFDKGRIKLNRRGYEIFDLAYTDVKVELLYGIDKKKRGHTRFCLVGPAGERHLLSDWKRNSFFAGEDSSTLLAHLLNRGIKIIRDPYVIKEFEATLPAHRQLSH